jgi:tetratricopeptide (TPR) repeat protein
MTRPQIDLTHVHTQSIGLETIRFVHAENVFEFFLLVETLEGVACFNQFLECIGHPQRIFNIDDGGSWWEKETAALICADKARFPEILQQLNHGDDLDCKAEMPPLPTKSKILGDLCDMCISSDKFGNRSNLDYYGDCLVEYYTADPQENISLSTQILIAQALSLKAGYLQQLGSNAERQERHGYRAKERASYEFIIEHFEQHPALPETIGRAWSGLGRCFLLEAKSAWNDAPAARELLRKARTALETAHEKRLNSGAVLGNLAYALWLSGETKDAETTLRHAFSSLIESGEKLYEGMCSDIAAYPIPSDAGFKKTLDGYGKKLVPPHK